jgi:hypothetical protein
MNEVMVADAGGNLIAGVFFIVGICLILRVIKLGIEKLTAPKVTEFSIDGSITESR